MLVHQASRFGPFVRIYGKLSPEIGDVGHQIFRGLVSTHLSKCRIDRPDSSTGGSLVYTHRSIFENVSIIIFGDLQPRLGRRALTVELRILNGGSNDVSQALKDLLLLQSVGSYFSTAQAESTYDVTM